MHFAKQKILIELFEAAGLNWLKEPCVSKKKFVRPLIGEFFFWVPD